MSLPRDQDQRRAVYRATAEALARVQAAELAALTDEQARRQIEALTTIEAPWHPQPEWSGLVEQQAIFHRRRRS